MLRDRVIKRWIEVFVKDITDPHLHERKARVVNVYPYPSKWMVVKYEDGDNEQIEEKQVTTMFEIIKQNKEI